MLFNAIRFTHDFNAARIYYAVRSLDVKGQGWIDVEHRQLEKAAGLSASRVRAVLTIGADLGWFTYTRKNGRVYVKYTSDRKFARQHGSEFATLDKSTLNNPGLLKERVTLTRVVYEQYRVEAKLHRKIWNCKTQWKQILDQQDDRTQLRTTLGAVRSRNVFVNKDEYTIGLTQAELAKRLKLPLSTLKTHLRHAPHVVPYKPVTLKEAMADEGQIICDEEKGKFYRRMPNYYLDTITKKAHQKRLLKLRFNKLDPRIIQVAMLLAVNMGYAHSRSGAIKAITKMGFARFWRNLDPILRETEEGRAREAKNQGAFRAKLKGKTTTKPEKKEKPKQKKASELESETKRFFEIA